MKRRVVLIFASFLLLSSKSLSASNWLFKNGNSEYQIILSNDASISELTAARELQDYIHQISGVLLPITSDIDDNCKHIFVGYSNKVGELTGEPKPNVDDESFSYCRIGNDILIWGGSQRGTMYGVFTFLERELGVHWLTPDCTIVPRRNKWRVLHINHHDSPAIKYRYSNYYVSEGRTVWFAHNKENMRGPGENDYGGQDGYWGCHTMGLLVRSDEFYQSHPDYFCLRKGRRVNEQLCLSNPKVLELCKERLIKVIREHPDFRIYDLSQNDNNGFCECEKCKELEEKYGGHSGIILWFVNQVADAIKEEFPDKYIGTFAYRFSRKPPIGIVPRDNVVIRLCSIECCFAHPIEADCPQNKAFMDDLRGWSAIAPHLFVWDYIVDFSQYLAPWPNFQVLAPNIKTFRDYHVIGVFEEANYQAVGGEFEELKSWVVSQLLWNPNQNTDSLVNVFIKGYYGKAAQRVIAYYRLCKSLVKRNTHFDIYIGENHELYSERFITRASKILNDALVLAENDTIRDRVERVKLQPLYLYCMRNKEQAQIDGNWNELERIMRKYKAQPSEHQTIEQFLSHK